jgi:23S rRNA (cytidine1920-2'-O)/16S rRNA (cytidine1409-2'-O)-methyltransferase
VRLDQLLVERGLFDSRARAGASVLAGAVLVGPGRERASKPGMRLDLDTELSVVGGPRYASRGGLKLARALTTFALDVSGRRCLDVGASTGGFTDCLLQAGAARVVALDVAYGQLDWRLRNDERVTVIERKNARELRPDELPYAPELIVVDVSFIGLAKVLPALAACAAPRFDLLALVKPQFEAGRARVGKGGVVRNPADRFGALVSVGVMARSLGFSVLGFCSSGLPGPAGNRESFIWCADQGRGGIHDIRAAALMAEPETAPASADRG